MTSLATQVIERCRSLGIKLIPTDQGVKCLAPAGTMTRDLQAVIKAKRNEIRDRLVEEDGLDRDAAEFEFGSYEPTPPLPVTYWPAGVGKRADFAMLLTAEDLPTAPFEVSRGRVVVNPEKFLRALQADVKHGANGPRARTGVLHDELLLLHEIVLASLNSIL